MFLKQILEIKQTEITNMRRKHYETEMERKIVSYMYVYFTMYLNFSYY